MVSRGMPVFEKADYSRSQHGSVLFVMKFSEKLDKAIKEYCIIEKECYSKTGLLAPDIEKTYYIMKKDMAYTPIAKTNSKEQADKVCAGLNKGLSLDEAVK
jgi:hypothetical protein